MAQPDPERPVPPRVMREVERILDGVAKRLFLERLERDALIDRLTAARGNNDPLDEHPQDGPTLGERHFTPIPQRRQRRRTERRA